MPTVAPRLINPTLPYDVERESSIQNVYRIQKQATLLLGIVRAWLKGQSFEPEARSVQEDATEAYRRLQEESRLVIIELIASRPPPLHLDRLLAAYQQLCEATAHACLLSGEENQRDWSLVLDFSVNRCKRMTLCA